MLVFNIVPKGYFNLCIISQYQVLKEEDKQKKEKYLSRYYAMRKEIIEDSAL